MFDNGDFSVIRNIGLVDGTKQSTRSHLPHRAKNLSKFELQIASRNEKECNAKAQRIVEAMLDPLEDVDRFLLMLQDINRSHLEDVVEERAIEKLCGYPLCKQTLGKISKQKLRISLASKAVYDMTEKKHFCSSECFKSTNYIKDQMLTTPLWLRDCEDIPTFKLLNGYPETKTVQNTVESIIPSIDELKMAEKNVDGNVRSSIESIIPSMNTLMIADQTANEEVQNSVESIVTKIDELVIVEKNVSENVEKSVNLILPNMDDLLM